MQSPPSVRPSVRPSRYLLLNHWTKSNQIWCVGCSHEWGVQRHIFFFAPPPGALGRGQKVKYHQISLKLNYKVNLKDFLTKLCVSSHTWKILNISDGIFIWRPGSCPRGRTWGYRGGLGGSKNFFFRNSTRFGVWVSYMKGICTGAIFGVPTPWGLREGPKGQISLNLN